MAKINQGSLVSDIDNKLIFTDTNGSKHWLYWNSDNNSYELTDEYGNQDTINGITSNVLMDRSPNVTDDSYTVPTIWVDTSSDISYICSDNTTGDAIWEPIIKGLVISDEYVDIATKVTKLNFVGDGVQSSIESDGSVTIIVGTAEILMSHWNSNDGWSDNTVQDALTEIRFLSDSVGSFPVYPTWLPGDQVGVIKGRFLYTSPGACLFDDELTTITATAIDADGTIFTHNITVIYGDITSSNNNITITVANFSPNQSKFKANIEVSFNDDGSWVGGYTVDVSHTSLGIDYTKTQAEIMLDNDVYPAVINNAQTDISDTLISNVYISGIRYLSIDDIIDLDISGIDYINALTYPQDQISIDGSNYGVSIKNLIGSDLSGWDNAWDNVSASASVPLAIDIIDYRSLGSGSISVSPLDWGNEPVTTTPPHDILIDTYGNLETDTEETFTNELFRVSPSGSPWVSSQYLLSDELMIFNGMLQQQFGDWSSYIPQSSHIQPNYDLPSASGQYYIRDFSHQDVAHTNGRIEILDINGITEDNITNEDIKIEISFDGVSWFNAGKSYLSGPLEDGDGCRVGVGVSDLPYIDFTLGTGGYTDETTGPSGWGIYLKVTLNVSSLYINGLGIIDWV